MSTNYAINRRDFEYLERIFELSDQQELDAERLALMENPTKQRAAELYRAGIRLWFQEHGSGPEGSYARRISKRYGITP